MIVYFNNSPLFIHLYKQLGFHREPFHLMPSTRKSNGHFINEQILRSLSHVYCTKGISMPTKAKLFIFYKISEQ